MHCRWRGLEEGIGTQTANEQRARDSIGKNLRDIQIVLSPLPLVWEGLCSIKKNKSTAISPPEGTDSCYNRQERPPFWAAFYLGEETIQLVMVAGWAIGGVAAAAVAAAASFRMRWWMVNRASSRRSETPILS